MHAPKLAVYQLAERPALAAHHELFKLLPLFAGRVLSFHSLRGARQETRKKNAENRDGSKMLAFKLGPTLGVRFAAPRCHRLVLHTYTGIFLVSYSLGKWQPKYNSSKRQRVEIGHQLHTSLHENSAMSCTLCHWKHRRKEGVTVSGLLCHANACGFVWALEELSF